MKVLEFLKDNIIYLDGGMGTLLQKEGLKPGEYPERWNISNPDKVTAIHQAYFDAGSNIVVTNTFGANSLKYDQEELEAIVKAAIENARKAAQFSAGKQEKFVALDIGPMGKLLKPYGDFEYEDAVETYAGVVRLGAKYEADLIFIETMNDSLDTKAALLAAKENSDLPVFVSNAYGDDGKLMTGASPEAMIAMLEGMGADAVGVNCSLGPLELKDVVAKYLEYASVPVILKPNAGLPKAVDGKTVFDIQKDTFGNAMAGYLEDGVRIAGGCCGTTPEYIQQLVDNTRGLQPGAVFDKGKTLISSYTHAVEFGGEPVLIGERINPTGKKKFKEALRSHDMDYILREGLAQQDRGAHVLDVNVGLPEIDEPAMLKQVAYELQSIIDLPLQIDTMDMEAMEAVLRQYNGKAMINSVNGKEEVMDKVFPLAKKYGGLVVCLTLDDDGIPETWEGRVAIAKKIIKKAEEYGIKKKDLIFDTLTMAISADSKGAATTLKALEVIRNELGCHTSLGVSNVSFGLPNRDVINSAFFAMALERGLSAAIMNPKSDAMMSTYFAFKSLGGFDENCAGYIENIEKFVSAPAAASAPLAEAAGSGSGGANGAAGFGGSRWAAKSEDIEAQLQNAIVRGLKEEAGKCTKVLLETKAPLDIVNQQIIPALDIVGKGFEDKTMFLPQLLMAAEASQCAFGEIKKKVEAGQAQGEQGQESKAGQGKMTAGNPDGAAGQATKRCKFVIATVKGDIHDIGKNIVKLILENYGFQVVDLGKDVAPETIVSQVEKDHAPLVGLSALMTTTVPAMEETIKLLRERAPWCKVCVGGAVLTEEYAKMVGADFYGKDAMATVRFAMEQE